jgi:hypothetical protein
MLITENEIYFLQPITRKYWNEINESTYFTTPGLYKIREILLQKNDKLSNKILTEMMLLEDNDNEEIKKKKMKLKYIIQHLIQGNIDPTVEYLENMKQKKLSIKEENKAKELIKNKDTFLNRIGPKLAKMVSLVEKKIKQKKLSIKEENKAKELIKNKDTFLNRIGPKLAKMVSLVEKKIYKGNYENYFLIVAEYAIFITASLYLIHDMVGFALMITYLLHLFILGLIFLSLKYILMKKYSKEFMVNMKNKLYMNTRRLNYVN